MIGGEIDSCDASLGRECREAATVISVGAEELQTERRHLKKRRVYTQRSPRPAKRPHRVSGVMLMRKQILAGPGNGEVY